MSHHHDDESIPSGLSRRELLTRAGKAAAASVVALPLIEIGLDAVGAAAAPLTAITGIDRITLLSGKTYLNAWAGYGDPPRRGNRRPAPGAPPRNEDATR